MINLIIADDHTLFRKGIISFFDGDESISVIGEASHGLELIEMMDKFEVDVVLLDISMPVLDGIETSRRLKKDYPDTKIIMLTMHETQNYVRTLLEIGVDGYLLKTTSREELLTAIRTVLNGQSFYGGDVQKTFMDSFNSDKVTSPIKLTRREKEVLLLICDEHNTNEIAEKLFISNHTVESHRKNLLSKTGSKNVAGLVKFALQNKFI
jgi:DNA-binding NarL/FixJ family response regulator